MQTATATMLLAPKLYRVKPAGRSLLILQLSLQYLIKFCITAGIYLRRALTKQNACFTTKVIERSRSAWQKYAFIYLLKLALCAT